MSISKTYTKKDLINKIGYKLDMNYDESKILTDCPGSSNWFKGSLVAYSNDIKKKIGVGGNTITTEGAVSKKTSQEMAASILKFMDADISLAVTGLAGPDGGTNDKPVGLVFFSCCQKGVPPKTESHLFSGNRDDIRQKAVDKGIEIIKLSFFCSFGLYFHMFYLT